MRGFDFVPVPGLHGVDPAVSVARNVEAVLREYADGFSPVELHGMLHAGGCECGYHRVTGALSYLLRVGRVERVEGAYRFVGVRHAAA